MTDYYKRGDIVLADLDPVVGSEQGGTRPVLVIQNDIGNKYSNTIIVSVITTALKKQLPIHISLDDSFLEPHSTLLLEQIRTIDKHRIKCYLGTVDSFTMKIIDHALTISVGIESQKKSGLYLTLCQRCAQVFYDSPYHIVKRVDINQQIKEPCTYCGCRDGFDYRIIPKKNLDK